MPKLKDKEPRGKKPRGEPPQLPSGCEALLTKAQICAALGVSLRTLQGMVSGGEFPREDLRLGVLPRWRVRTLNAWIEEKAGGRRLQTQD